MFFLTELGYLLKDSTELEHPREIHLSSSDGHDDVTYVFNGVLTKDRVVGHISGIQVGLINKGTFYHVLLNGFGAGTIAPTPELWGETIDRLFYANVVAYINRNSIPAGSTYDCTAKLTNPDVLLQAPVKKVLEEIKVTIQSLSIVMDSPWTVQKKGAFGDIPFESSLTTSRGPEGYRVSFHIGSLFFTVLQCENYLILSTAYGAGKIQTPHELYRVIGELIRHRAGLVRARPITHVDFQPRSPE